MIGEYRTSRHVLRQYPGIVEVNAFAEREGWPIISETPGDPARGVPYQVAWYADGTVLDYAEDDVSKSSFFYLAGPHSDLVQNCESIAVAALTPLAVPELARDVLEAKTGPKRGRALLRLGLGSSAEFDRDVFQLISEGLQDTDPQIRNVSVYATTYSPWAEFRPLLERIVGDDPEDDVRVTAAGALRAYDKGGVN